MEENKRLTDTEQVGTSIPNTNFDNTKGLLTNDKQPLPMYVLIGVCKDGVHFIMDDTNDVDKMVKNTGIHKLDAYAIVSVYTYWPFVDMALVCSHVADELTTTSSDIVRDGDGLSTTSGDIADIVTEYTDKLKLMPNILNLTHVTYGKYVKGCGT